MKILQISKLFPPFWGGIETVVYDLSIGLKQKGNDVDILCVSSSKYSEVSTVDGLRVFRCSSFAHIASAYLSLSFFYKWFLCRNSYDVVHVHLPNPLAILALFAFRTKSRLFVHWHSDIVRQKYLKIPFIPLQRWLLGRCEKIIATSKTYADASQDLAPFKDKIVVIPIGIDHKVLSVNARKRDSLLEEYKGKKIIFSLGRHVYYKGFEYLIDAAKYLPDNCVVLIGGSGELTDKYECIIRRANIEDKVKLVGRIDMSDLGAYYDACDVFCLPSIERSEAFGVVQLEAMSLGKPVVSTDIPGSGVCSINKVGVTGLVSPVRDAKALAGCIVHSLFHMNWQRDLIYDFFYANYRREIMVELFSDVLHRDH